MTYAEMTQTTATLFPSNVSDDFKQAVYDWFQYREVCDDDKFPVFFRRKVAEDYGRYMEMLRVEPGYAKYDWMVTLYKEQETRKTGDVTTDTSREITSSGTRANTTTRTGSSQATVNQTSQKRGTDTTATDGTETLNTQDALTGTETLARTGTQTAQRTDNLAGTQDDTITRTLGQIIEDEMSRNLATSENRSTESANDVINVNKVLPQESGGLTRGSVMTENIPQLQGMNWQYASDMSEQTAHGADHATGGTTSTGTETRTRRPGVGHDDEVLARQTTSTGTQTTQTTNDLQDQTTYNTKRAQTGTIANEVDEVVTYNSDETVAGTSNKSLTDNSSLEGTNTGSSSEQGAKNISQDLTERDRYTGRDRAPAELLREAVSYIKGTCAWEWMYNQLNVCFLATYDV